MLNKDGITVAFIVYKACKASLNIFVLLNVFPLDVFTIPYMHIYYEKEKWRKQYINNDKIEEKS